MAVATAAAVAQGLIASEALVAASPSSAKPMELGLLIVPFGNPEEHFRRVREIGFAHCFLSLDGYIDGFTPQLAKQFLGLLAKYHLTATSVEVVGPGPRKWNFSRGPATIGLVPPATREARIDALRQVSDFAEQIGVSQVQTHCGFIPEDPGNPLYESTVEAIHELARHCQSNGQEFLMETGQETPTTVSRTLRDVAMPNVGVGLDTANLILYGKANPVDAVDILGPHIRSVHAKDGRWPTDPSELGEEVLIGKGRVDFRAVLSGLRRVGYQGTITIERETSGPQQVSDIRDEKLYLERMLRDIGN